MATKKSKSKKTTVSKKKSVKAKRASKPTANKKPAVKKKVIAKKKPAAKKKSAVKKKRTIKVKNLGASPFHLDDLPTLEHDHDEIPETSQLGAEPVETDVVEVTTVSVRSHVSFFIGMFFGAIVLHTLLLSILVFATI